MHRITLIEVDSQAEERDVAQRLALLRRQGGIPIVPVRRNGLAAVRMRRIAQACGYEVQIESYIGSRDLLLNHSIPIEQYGHLADGLAIVPVGKLDPFFPSLACTVSGGSLVMPSEIERADDQRLPRALVIHDGNAAHELCDTVGCLSRRGIPFGLVVISDDSSIGHLALLKALMFPVVEIQDVDWPETLGWPLTRYEETIPARAVDPDEVERRHAQRMLVLNGHGNAVDLGKAGVVICARGREPEIVPPRAYPCFRDRLCFRQPIFGRSPTSTVGLVDPGEIGHPVVLLLGCGTMPLGNAPFHICGTMIGQIGRSHSIGGFASIGILYHDFNVEMLLIALLLDGHSLGDVARLFNAWHRDTYGLTSPAWEGTGPLIAFGNPNLRVRSTLIQRLCLNEDIPPRISASTVRFSGSGLAVLKVKDFPEGAFAVDLHGSIKRSAVWIPSEGLKAETLYLSLLSHTKSPLSEDIIFQPIDHNKQIEEIDALRDSLAFLQFWRTFLVQAGRRLQSGENGNSGIEGASCLLDRLELLALQYLSTNPSGTEQVLPTSDLVEAHSSVFSLWMEWQRSMLSAALLYILKSGGFTFHLWQDLYHRERNRRILRACPSCTRENAVLLFQSHLNPSDAHEVIHCPVCGVIGELPADIGVIVKTPTANWHRGREERVSVEIENRRNKPIAGCLTLVRECWFHQTPDLTQIAECRIHPGGKMALTLTFNVPPGITGGIYPLTLIGVLNGGLAHLRCHLPVVDEHHYEFAMKGA